MAVVDQELSSQVELFISCRNLPKFDLLSDSDPFIVVFAQDPITKKYHEFGRTETIQDNHFPDFVKQFLIQYHFEENQSFRFDVYDSDSPSPNLDKHDFIGTTTVTLADIVTAQGQVLEENLLNKSRQQVRNQKSQKQSTIILRCEEVAMNLDIVKLKFKAEELTKMDWCCGKSDPYLEIFRSREDGSWMTVVKTDVIMKNLNPYWKEEEYKVQTICNGDYDRPLWLKCFDWNHQAAPDLIGESMTSLRSLTSKQGYELPLIRQKNNDDSKTYGRVIVEKSVVQKGYSLLEFVRGGCQISLMVAIDFTASNEDPMQPTSLHYMGNPANPNEYVKAIQAIGNVLQPYDSDNMFPVWGFGAKINGAVSHCFSLTFDEAQPEVRGVEGILQVYRQAFDGRLKLSGPTLFAQIVNTASAMASEPYSAYSQHYSILLILTDGIINDRKNTIDSIVAASDKPLSIIIVGVGGADFADMDYLDADDERLVDSRGKKQKRDNVQFVPFREVADYGSSRIAKETLEEIPEQFSSFMRMHNIKPMEHDASAPPGLGGVPHRFESEQKESNAPPAPHALPAEHVPPAAHAPPAAQAPHYSEFTMDADKQKHYQRF